MTLTPITFRATPADLSNLTAISARLQAAGYSFTTKTAAVQYALKLATETPHLPAPQVRRGHQ